MTESNMETPRGIVKDLRQDDANLEVTDAELEDQEEKEINPPEILFYQYHY